MISMDSQIGGMVFSEVFTDSASALRRRLRLGDLDHVIVLEDERSEGLSGILIQTRLPGYSWKGHLVVFVDQNISHPRIALHSEKGRYWIAWEKSIAVITPFDVKVEHVARFDYIYCDIVTCSSGNLLVVHELGAICYDENCRVLWSINGSDRLVDFSISDRILTCKFDNGTELSHEIE